MNPWLRWIGLIAGFIIGAIVGVIVTVFVAGILLFVIYPMFAGEVN